MPTTAESSSPLLSPVSSTGTTSSHALSTPSSSDTSPTISLIDAHTTTSSGSSSCSLVNGPATLHKRAPPSLNPPAPARLQQIHNMYSSPSTGSSSSSYSTPPTSNKLIKREHPTLGSLHDLQPSAKQHQGNRLRKAIHNGDPPKVGPSFNVPDEVALLADDGPLSADVTSPRSATHAQAPSLPSMTYQTATLTKAPPRPEVVRQQSYSKRHASFDTPRTEVPLPFFSEPFPRELERHQQRRSDADEPTGPPSPSPTRHSRAPPLPIPASATAPSGSQPRPPSPTPLLNRNNSAPTPPSSPLAAPTPVQDLKEAESLRDRVEWEDNVKEAPWPSVVPSSITPPSSEESTGRRSTASLPLPRNHEGEPFQLSHRLEVLPPPILPSILPPTSITFSTSSALHTLSSIPAPPASASFAPTRAFSLPPQPPPAAPEISTPPTTLHPLLDIPASVSSSSSASNSPPQAHASVLTQSSAPSSSAPTPVPSNTSALHPTTSTSTTILNSPPPPQSSTATPIATGPQGPHMTVQTTSTAYILTTFLPGYQRDEITLSTRKRRVLHVVADSFISSSHGAGHFERRISFGYDVDMARIRAEFNGGVLKIVVPRRPTMSAPAGYDSKLGLGGQQGSVWNTSGQ